MKKLLLLSFLAALSLSAWSQKTKLVITTEYGKIEMILYDNTPLHRDNMIKLIKQHFFDSSLFHRVIPGLVIQGGDPDFKHAEQGKHLGEDEFSNMVPAEINDSDFLQRGA